MALATDHVAADRAPALVDEVAGRFAAVGPGVLRLDATRPVAALAEEVRAAITVVRSV